MKSSVRMGMVAAGAALAMLPTSAMAATYDHADAAGDTSVISFTDFSMTPDPANSLGDATSVSVDYSKRTLTMVTTLAAVGTADGDAQMVTLSAGKGKWSYEFGAFVATDGTTTIVDRDFSAYKSGKLKRAVKCKKLRVKADLTAGTITMTAPSSCVRSASSVRFTGFTGFMNANAEQFWMDDAFSDVALTDASTEVGTSPAVARGGTAVVTDPAPTTSTPMRRGKADVAHLVRQLQRMR